jgi:hypothetical protein
VSGSSGRGRDSSAADTARSDQAASAAPPPSPEGEALWAAVERYRAATLRVKNADPSAEAWDELVDARRALNGALSGYANAP